MCDKYLKTLCYKSTPVNHLFMIQYLSYCRLRGVMQDLCLND